MLGLLRDLPEMKKPEYDFRKTNWGMAKKRNFKAAATKSLNSGVIFLVHLLYV